MQAGIIALFMTFCTCIWSTTTGLPVPVNMCGHSREDSQTGKSRELVLLKESRSSSEEICSCDVWSEGDFYIRLKSRNSTHVFLSVTYDNEIFPVDLPDMIANWNESDCLILSGDKCKPFRPRSCLRNTNDRSIALAVNDSLAKDSYIYLDVLGEELVHVNCSLIKPNASKSILNQDVINNQDDNTTTTSGYSDDTSTQNDMEDECMETSTTEEPAVYEGSTQVSTTTHETAALLLLQAKKLQEADRMMTASMIMLPIAGVVLLASLLVLAIAFRKQRHSKATVSTRRRGSSRRAPKQAQHELPSYYEEVDEDLHIKAAPEPVTTSKDNMKPDREYAEATNPDDHSLGDSYSRVSALDNRNYEVAKSMTADVPKQTVVNQQVSEESDYNVAAYNPPKKKSSAGIDGTYDVTQPVTLNDFSNDNDGLVYTDPVEESKDLVLDGSQGTSEPAELTQVSGCLSPAETGPQKANVYSLQRFVSHEEKEKPEESRIDKIAYDNNEKIKEIESLDQRRSSVPSELVDDELYANFSSLQSETLGSLEVPQEDPPCFEDDEEIYMNHATKPADATHADDSLDTTQGLCSSPRETYPGYINIQMDKSKPSLSSDLTDSSEMVADDDIYQNPGVTGSTVSLLDSSDSEDLYANYQPGMDTAKDTNDPKPTDVKNAPQGSKVEVVFLPQPTTHPVADKPRKNDKQRKKKSPKPAQRQSVSVDDSSRLHRKDGSRRTRSDDTLLLSQLPSSASGSEDDVLMMVNNVLYEGMKSGHPNPKGKHNNKASSNPSVDTDPDQFLLLSKDEGEDEDVIIMMNNDLYESFNVGGAKSILPDDVSEEMKDKLKKKYNIPPVNENTNTESEKL